MIERDKEDSPSMLPMDSGKETRILMEEVRSELKVVAEGHGLIVGRLDKVEGYLERVAGKLEQHDFRFDKLEHRFDKFEGRFDKFEGRFDHLEGRFDHLEKQFGPIIIDHEHRLKAVERRLKPAS